ncbi:EscN/YscN/HrcN family type III secretion system ATPase [Parashewanella spongiae]|uniref:EscN/YscN/HrcN family type III secretion system ATPase n=1 Tax=Parashewanella spongiae TaxID=342950 RepID=A0A3A6UBH1_9GAMM|nr:EscN/YscN/HrcN family type III secretion system ATPase [Parashewanella spongiae]MCL1076954.1 EscN/YscN/HrcN family type III secretion system ATPase [Parashewanella spongiae]RJY18930.1 EscN/YscN/HrcN family type III secretion system ATPase [Parashewanella spongiae]
MKLPEVNEIVEELSEQLFLNPFDVQKSIPSVRFFGRIKEVGATLVRSSLTGAHQGDLCLIAGKLKAEVIGVNGDEALLSPFDSTTGLQTGEDVELLGHGHEIALGDGLLGRVLDGLGRPIDEGDLVTSEVRLNQGSAPNPLSRSLIKDILPLGIKAIDSVLTCGVGQRVGIFAAAGGGKSTLLGMIASKCDAEVIVLALVGERGREVKEFLEYNLTPEAKKRTVMVVSTSDRPPLERMKATITATTIAEYFRDKGKNVLLMVDSLTRFARSAREIGLAAGEPAVSNGFPPSVFVKLSSLVERAGPAAVGSITGIYSVLVEGDDMNEPIADEVRSLLDGHIILSRKLAGAGQYPAIDINASVSRVMDQIVPKEQQMQAAKLRKMLASYEDVQLLIRVGEYETGQDEETDEAIERYPAIQQFLRQTTDEYSAYEDTQIQLNSVTFGNF